MGLLPPKAKVPWLLALPVATALLGPLSLSVREPPAAAQTIPGAISLGRGGIKPISVAVNPTTNRVYSANGVSESITVMDGTSGLGVASGADD